MDLFERAGIILKSGEKILKRGRCTGKVVKGLGKSAWTGEPKIEREKVDGEMVLTNQRLIFLGGRIDDVVIFPDLDIRYLFAVRRVKVYPEDDLLLLVNIGFGKPEEIQLQVEEAPEWVEAIKSQADASRKETKEQEEKKDRLEYV